MTTLLTSGEIITDKNNCQINTDVLEGHIE